MPRAGLNHDQVVAAAAELADEIGFHGLTMGLLADRLGVRTPSLYKHIDSLGDLQHGVASLAIAELGERVRDALQGKAGPDALAAFGWAFRSYVLEHPGRYTATLTAEFTGSDDPLLRASTRLVDSAAAVLQGYGIAEQDMDHALRTVRCVFHGFASLQASDSFQWTGDPEESFNWMIHFIDQGLGVISASSKVRLNSADQH